MRYSNTELQNLFDIQKNAKYQAKSRFKIILPAISVLGYNLVRIIAGYASPMSVVMPSKILASIILALAPKILGNSAPSVLTDYQILENKGLDFGVLPIGIQVYNFISKSI